MTKLKLIAATALLATVVASPVLARDMNRGRVVSQQSYDNSYDRRDSGFYPADVAAGVVGGAIGAAGAIASAPFRDAYAYDDGYNGYTYGNGYRGNYINGGSYAARNGFVCQPGTVFRNENGQPTLCQ